jgi:hypothetical protein
MARGLIRPLLGLSDFVCAGCAATIIAPTRMLEENAAPRKV